MQQPAFFVGRSSLQIWLNWNCSFGPPFLCRSCIGEVLILATATFFFSYLFQVKASESASIVIYLSSFTLKT